VLSVRASGDPNHSFAFPPYDRALVHRFNDNPSPLPFPSSPLVLETLAPLRDSREEVRKRLIAPRVNMSSVDMLNPDEAGAMEDDDRRRNGLNRLLGFVAQEDLLDVVGDEPPAVGVACLESSGSGRVDVDSLRAASPHGGDEVSTALGFFEIELQKHGEAWHLDTGLGKAEDEVPGEDDDEDVEGTAIESSFAEMKSPPRPETRGVQLSSGAPASSALGSGKGAKRILRELGIELLRAPGWGLSGALPGSVPLKDWDTD